ncbi:MAG: ABC transporter substrate-binding protein [Coriobacteriales bacterium]|nr:ABC transporter substrate-binding protein [Coriobacteriales bacterium]
MKKKFSILAICACLLGVMSIALVGCGGSQSSSGSSASSDEATSTAATTGSYTLVKDGTLTCVTEMGFAPFEYMEAGSTEPIGYDIDVANEVAKRMGLTCEFLPSQSFDSLVPTIKEGAKADIAIAGITINDERAKEIDFSDPYFSSNLAVIVKSDAGATLESLNAEAMKVACQTGTTGDAWIEENLTKATKVPLADVAAGLAGVSTGSYNAYVIDLPVAEKYLKDFSDLTILEKIATGEEYGIVVSKDNPELTKAINKALGEMKSDGTIANLEAKWLSSGTAA